MGIANLRLTYFSVLLRSAVYTVLPSCSLVSYPVAGETVTGNVEVNGFTRQGATAYRADVPFTVSFNGLGHWRIRTGYANYDEIAGSDTERTCSVMRFVHLPKDVGAPAYVVNGTHPFQSEPTTKLVWLAFASSAYFSADTNPLPALWNRGFNDPVSHAMKMKVEFLPSPAKLPARVDFFFSRKSFPSGERVPFFTRNLSRMEINKELNKAKSQDGKMIAEYRVTATTNVAGRVLPTDFSLEVVYYHDGGPSRLQSYHGIVTTIAEDAPASFLPAVRGLVSVHDYRFFDDATKLDRIEYVVTNGDWPSTNDIMLQDLFSRKKTARAALVPKVGPKTGAALTMVFLAFVVVGFPILVFALSKGGKAEQEPT